MEFLKRVVNKRIPQFRGTKNKNGSELASKFFCAFLFVVFVVNIVVPDKSVSENENRMLQKFPGISVKEYIEGRLSTKLEKYVSDQFVGRGAMIRVKSSFDVAAGGIKSNGVWKGKSGYLIEDTTIPEDGFIDSTVEAIAKFKKANPKVRMNFLLAPNAVSIMKNKLPAGANPQNQNIYMDEFFNALEKEGIGVVDVRDSFSDAAKSTQLYYLTDHHWNYNGAKIAFDEIRKTLNLGDAKEFNYYPVKNDFVGTLASKSGFSIARKDSITLPARPKEENLNSVITFTDEQKKTTKFYQLDKLKTQDAYQVFGGSNHSEYTIKTPVKGNRRLLLIKDSYANSVIPYLTQYYTEIEVVDPRYYYDNIQDIIDIEGINDVLFLHNANTFFGDSSLRQMLED